MASIQYLRGPVCDGDPGRTCPCSDHSQDVHERLWLVSCTFSRRTDHAFKVFSQSGAVLGRYGEADGLDSGLA